ncbi:ABC transporter permease [bacterium]|nr:ABC transporter permease [bacterium]
MHLTSAWHLVLLSLRARWRSNLWVAVGMAVGMLALGAAILGGVGFGRSLSRHLSDLVPESRVLLRPRSANLFWIKVDTGRITPETVALVQDLKGVRRVSPEASIRFPVSVEAEFLGSGFQSDVAVTGVEAWVLGEDAPEGFEYRPGGALPCVLASYFLDLYNMTLAEGGGMPKLSRGAALGREFDLILGESTLRMGRAFNEGDTIRRVSCRLGGLTSNPNLLGLIVPLEAVETFNAWHGAEEKIYQSLHVELASPDAIADIEPRLADLGLELVDTTATWRRAVYFVKLVGWGFVGFGFLVFGLAVAYLMSSVNWTLARRRRERGIMQAVGASRRIVTILLTAETALVSGAGILAGLVGSGVIFHFLNAWYEAWRSGREYLPRDLVYLPWPWLALAGAACWVGAIALAMRRIRRETRATISSHLGRMD